MSLIQVNNPIVDDNGLKNCFRGYIPTFFELKREDIQISTIRPQTIGGSISFVEITTVGNFAASQDLKVGDSITFTSPVYGNKTAIILQKAADPTNIIVVDVPYIGDDDSGAGIEIFVNYLKNWFVQYRIIDPTTDNSVIIQQDEVFNLFDFLFTSQSEIDGKVELDLSVANNKNKPSLEIGLNTDMFIHFKLQWRELFLGTVDDWVSPDFFPTKTDDSSYIFFHASDPNVQENGIDKKAQNNTLFSPIKPGETLRFWNNVIPKVNFLRSLIDEPPGTNFRLRIIQKDITGVELDSSTLEITQLDGIHTLELSDVIILDNTVFLSIDPESFIDEGEYNDLEYNDPEYKTN